MSRESRMGRMVASRCGLGSFLQLLFILCQSYELALEKHKNM